MIRSEKGTPDQNAARTLWFGCLVALLILIFGNWLSPNETGDLNEPIEQREKAAP